MCVYMYICKIYTLTHSHTYISCMYVYSCVWCVCVFAFDNEIVRWLDVKT